MENIPIQNKYILSIDEAAEYFRIGQNKLRRVVNDNPSADFVLWNGMKCGIKRKKFEEFIDKVNSI